MIALLIVCSPPLDGSFFTCPDPDTIPMHHVKHPPKVKVIEDKDFTNPFDYITIPIWRYEF